MSTYDPSLSNRDLAPTTTAQRTWTLYNYVALWFSMSMEITTYQLASSLIAKGIDWKQAVGSRRLMSYPIAFSSSTPPRFVLRWAGIVVLALIQCFTSLCKCYAHPPSGIVVDDRGRVYFLYHGLGRIEPSGQLFTITEDSGGHWLTLVAKRTTFAGELGPYKRVLADGDTFLYGDGAPLALTADGSLYYGSNGSPTEHFPAGALAMARISPDGQRSLFSPALKDKLAALGDGITALTVGPDGLLYAATWKGFAKLNRDGSIAKIIHPLVVPDCDRDPADHNPANSSSPLFRGIAVDSAGNVYLAATSCHRVLKVEPNAKVSTILRSERPWAPTGIAIRGQAIYVLEYTNANGPRTEGWFPRVRRISAQGSVKTLAEVKPPASSNETR